MTPFARPPAKIAIAVRTREAPRRSLSTGAKCHLLPGAKLFKMG
jgi:hypothetical protein